MQADQTYVHAAIESVQSITTERASRSTEPVRCSLSAATKAETAQIKSSDEEKNFRTP
jgi:hypothetical protein